MRNLKCILLNVLVLFVPMAALAGDLDSPAAPASADSAMYTLEAIYDRLDAGTPGAKRAGAFTEPSAGPASTGHTLDDVMGKAPSVDDDDGAGVADVSSGKKFWGLKSDEWGLKTGTGTIVTDPAPIAKTGQTLCYDADGGVPIECSARGTWPGQDGYWAAQGVGVAWPVDRFTVNDGGTVTDNLTGLMWAQNANAEGIKTWAEALRYCNGLALGEHTDWRLPNVKELFSLIDSAFYDPALSDAAGIAQWTDGDAFTGVHSSNYWSSTTSAVSTSFAWYVNFFYGRVYGGSKDSSYYVWPVRGGQ